MQLVRRESTSRLDHNLPFVSALIVESFYLLHTTCHHLKYSPLFTFDMSDIYLGQQGYDLRLARRQGITSDDLTSLPGDGQPTSTLASSSLIPASTPIPIPSTIGLIMPSPWERKLYVGSSRKGSCHPLKAIVSSQDSPDPLAYVSGSLG
jgi:hypothetical protein